MYLILQTVAVGATTVSPADAELTIDGTALDRFGFQMEHGDLNDDGEVDLVVSAPHVTNGNAVYVFFGPLDLTPGSMLDASQADVTIETSGTDETGWSLAVGDATGDGVLDLLVGSPNYSNGRGRISLLDGPLSSGNVDLYNDASLSLDGTQVQGYVGWDVAAGDWDNDGIDEIAAGACREDSDDGNVYLFDADQLAASVVTTADATSALGGIGFTGCSVADLGDFDGDGTSDLGIGSYNAGFVSNGTTSIVYGRATFAAAYDLSSPSPTNDIANVIEPSIGANLGFDIEPAGDLNADGFADFLVGAPGISAGGSPSGRAGEVWVVLGGKSSNGSGRPLQGISQVSAVADLAYRGAASSSVGHSVSSAGWAGKTWGYSGQTVWDTPKHGPTLLLGGREDQGWIVAYDQDWRLGTAPTYECTPDEESGVYECEEVFGPNLGQRGVFDLATMVGVHLVDGDPGSALGLEVLGLPDQNGDGLNELVMAATYQADFSELPPAKVGSVLVFAGQ